MNFKTRIEIYQNIFSNKKKELIINGYTDDKSNRIAAIHAVKNTWNYFNKQFERIF